MAFRYKYRAYHIPTGTWHEDRVFESDVPLTRLQWLEQVNRWNSAASVDAWKYVAD